MKIPAAIGRRRPIPWPLLLALAALLAAAGCTRTLAAGEGDARRPAAPLSDPCGATAVERRLQDEYCRWQGTAHRLGGTDRRGVDCSGFVRAVFRDAFNIDLPRTSRQQQRRGSAVALPDLQPGDLVFFRPPDYPRHVGIYLGCNRFVHASKSAGVTLSRIDDQYWRNCYWTARRILSAEP
jgi:probable lipoprotein NlpC